MDIFLPIAICVMFVILFSICGWCCKRKREGTVYGYPGTNVTITTQSANPSPMVIPPYPIEARHPTPHAGAPAPGFAPQSSVPYPPPSTSPYPPTNFSGTYPATNAVPYPPTTVPYPPTSGNYSHGQPPPYDVAVNQPPIHFPGPTNEAYGKQAPYNPHY